MLNKFYADLYRLCRQKSSWIILIIAAGVFLFTGLSLGILTGNAPWIVRAQNTFRDTVAQYGKSGMDTSVFDETLTLIDQIRIGSRFEFAGQLMTYDMMLFITVFMGFYTVSEKSSGYVFFLEPGVKRSSAFLSKALILLLYCIALTAVIVLVLIAESFFFYRGMKFGSPLPFVLYAVLKMLLVFSYALIILFLSDRMRKSMSAVIFSVFYIMIGSNVFYTIVDSLFSKTSFRIEYCTPIGSMGLITLGDYKTYLGALIVIVIWTAVVFIEEISAR